MAIAPAQSAPPVASPVFHRVRPLSGDLIWRAPLMPVALALTLGLVIDRYFDLPWPIALVVGLVSGVAGVVMLLGPQKPLAWLYFMGVVASLGTLYHHAWRNLFPADDIGNFAPAEPRPARLCGVLAEEPTVILHPANDPFKSFRRSDPTRAVLEVSQMHDRWRWRAVSGKVQVMVEGDLTDFHVGDRVEIVGRLMKPSLPANPGEADYCSFLLDQRIRAILRVAKKPDGVEFLGQDPSYSVTRAFANVRCWGRLTFKRALPNRYYGLAAALLLGEYSQMMKEEWEKYKGSGVIHALAISGQHLAILAGFLWVFLRPFPIRIRNRAWLIGLFLFGYALMTGGRPPAMRAAVTVGALCLGLIIRRPVLLANSFALAWVVVALLNPTDLFTPGCQFSFLAVAVLYWGGKSWLLPSPDPLDRLMEETYPLWLRLLRGVRRTILLSYVVCGIIWLTEVPLGAAYTHLIPWAGLIIGPPVFFLTAIALITGFLMLIASLVCWPLALLFAKPTTWCLAGCDFLVTKAYTFPSSHHYLPDVPSWWLWVFYLGFLAVLLLDSLRKHWRWGFLVGLSWLCLGLAVGYFRTQPDGLRCTFLAVGHGGCAVLETPDGRTLLYDIGTIAGPDLARQQVAPFLWSRGIRRIDEVFLSHADLDHFNGLLQLADRFSIGEVTLTPTFAKKDLEAARRTLTGLRERGIPMRQVRAGYLLRAGDVTLQVLHPPRIGPEGRENFRSLVLLVRHEGHSLLLTGDLEGPGMQRVLELHLPRVDVLMAPHHGSRAANTPLPPPKGGDS